MATATTARVRVMAVLLAPLHWLERARGWRRRWLIAAYLFVLAIAGFFAWWLASLNGLPDVGEPFDVDAYLASARVPEGDNAFVLYRRALAAMKSGAATNDFTRLFGAARSGWGKVSPDARAWVESNRPALDLWLAGTERPEGVRARPDRVGTAVDYQEVAAYQYLGMAALIEGARLEASGDRAGALRMYLAVGRFNRHLSTKSRMAWRNAADMLDTLLRDRLLAWASDPEMEPALLREAIAAVDSPALRLPPASETLKAEYLALRAELADFAAFYRRSESGGDVGLSYDDYGRWLHLFWFVRREPERSRRVLNLIYANWLAQCDRPRALQAKPITNDARAPIWAFYVADPSAPEAANALEPDKLLGWLQSTQLLWRFLTPYPNMAPNFDPEGQARGTMLVFLAERLYFRETGAEAPSTEALAPKYLKAIPPEYVGVKPSR